MSDLNVTTIQNNNIAKTDKLLAFNNNDSKAASIQDVVQLVPGKMAVATCTTAGNVATKAVTCDDWTNKPGLSILVEFSNANSADNVTLSINNGTAIPVYYMNTATEQVSGGAIPAGAVVFTLNAAGNKFYAHVTKTLATVDTTSKLPVNSSSIVDRIGSIGKINGIETTSYTTSEEDRKTAIDEKIPANKSGIMTINYSGGYRLLYIYSAANNTGTEQTILEVISYLGLNAQINIWYRPVGQAPRIIKKLM